MSHYYTINGAAAHFQQKKDGSGTRPTTIRDCKALGLLPSVTTILGVLHKEALVQWMIRNSVHAFATSPELEGETLDQRIVRVLEVNREQDEESRIARERGSLIHEATELALNDVEYDQQWQPYVSLVLDAVKQFGRLMFTEKVFVHAEAGYAGKTDAGFEDDQWISIVDFKTTSSLPKTDSWWEHQLQSSAYANALGNTGEKRIRTANIYICTKGEPAIAVFVQEDWGRARDAFLSLLRYWQLTNLEK